MQDYSFACAVCDALVGLDPLMVVIPDPKGNEDCEGICPDCLNWLDYYSLPKRSGGTENKD